VSIFPLPIFERDADPAFRDALTDAEAYARLKPPSSIVVRFGSMKLVGEYPYDGDAKPGCGSKLVVRTHRGTELAEMLTSTCPNSGCSKSVSRREMLEYVENSGGKDYPFHTEGRVLRVATPEDLATWTALRERFRKEELAAVRERAAAMGLTMKIVEVEPILGGEFVVVHYLSEERVDFRELVPQLARHFRARVEMHQIGMRDEARLTADYEKCGQHCCCKNFLKVLKPVSMKSAKTQKASLDPLKISGRCGRLMCCLRYEDQTYEELRKRLPKNKSRVGTPDGPGTVIDGKILVQLVLVRLDHNGQDVAVPVEDLTPVDSGSASPPADTI
jgi:cell fate regulator YaaT (PSP1 superfamily)